MIALALTLLLTVEGQGRSLTLQQALDTAAQRQPALRQSRATTEGARALAGQALAPALPQVDLGARYQRGTANFSARPGSLPRLEDDGTSTGTTFDTFNYFSADAMVSQLLWDFGQTLGRYRSAQANVRAQEQNERATAVQVALDVRTAYFTARAQAELVEVATASLENQQAHQRQIDGFVQAGRRAPIDLAQARADVANSKVQLLKASNDYAIARARLNQSMGSEANIDFEVTDAPPGPVPGEARPIEALIDQALEARPESAEWEEKLLAQALRVQALGGGYFPRLGAGLNGTAAATRVDRFVPNLSFQLTLDWNLFGGGITHAQIAEAQAQQRVLEAQRDAYRLQVRVDVEQARLTVDAAAQALTASEEALSAAKERLTLAEGRYEVGAGSILELSDAQVAFTTAGAQRVQALYGLASARARLMAALGQR